jgi:acyl transferase domain-containing protein
MAEVPVKSVGLIEAAGSGEPENDARVVEAVCGLWGDHRPGEPLVGVGSIMGNIGHTMRASMSAGIVKAALALRYRVLPPQVTPDHPSEAIANLGSSAYLLTEPRPWITGDSSNPRRAAVMASNFIPSNPIGVASREGRSAAIVLEEEPEDRI